MFRPLSLLVLVALPPGVFWLVGRSAGLKVLVAEASMLLMAAWGALVYGLMVQNTAVAARLIPHHVRRLRELLGLGWCAALGLVGAVALLRRFQPCTIAARMAAQARRRPRSTGRAFMS